MFCLKCGKSIPEHSSFCMFCGTLIPQVSPEPVPEPEQKTVMPPLRGAAPPTDVSPFGEGEETLSLPLPLEEFVVKVPIEEEELETFSVSMEDTFSSESFSLPMEQFTPQVRHCKLCNKELTSANTSGYCVTCMNNRSFLPQSDANAFQLDLDLDMDYPPAYRETQEDPLPVTSKTAKKDKKKAAAPKGKKKSPLFPIILISVVMLGLAVFTAIYMSGILEIDSVGSSISPTAEEREVAGYAQKMVKEKAANPSSVHFDGQTLSVSTKDEIWTVKQSFQRMSPEGKTVESSYVAVLKIGVGANGYEPLMLQVDKDTLYDSR